MRFIDFFSGIGGFRLGMEQAGHECAGHCEIDKYADKSYRAMHEVKESEWFAKDITRVQPGDLPEAEVYCGGFPCQSFSIAGKRGGFEDTRGTLFFEIMRLAKERKPKYLFLENVKGLLSHDGGRTFGTILSTMGELGYDVEYQVLNSKNFGVPQNRERVFIVGHFGGRGGFKVFPIRESNKEANELQGQQNLANTIKARYEAGTVGAYIKEPVVNSVTTGPTHTVGAYVAECEQYAQEMNQVGQLYGTGREPNPQAGRVYDKGGISPSLDTCQGGNRMPKIIEPTVVNLQKRSADRPPLTRLCDCGSGELYCKCCGSSGGSGTLMKDDGTTYSLDTSCGQGVVIDGRRKNNGKVEKENAIKILQVLREKVGEKAFEKWGIAIATTLQKNGLLRQGVHETSIFESRDKQTGKKGSSLNSEENKQTDNAKNTMRNMWRQEELRRSSQGQQLSKQQNKQLASAVSQLSHENASPEVLLCYLWETSQGLQLLRKTLSEIQEVRQPILGKTSGEISGSSIKGGDVNSGVCSAEYRIRRLTPL